MWIFKHWIIKFQKFETNLSYYWPVCLSMLKADSDLDQNMKFVGNGFIKLPIQFQLNQSSVTCDITKLPLTAKCTVSQAVLRFHILASFFTLICIKSIFGQNTKILVLCFIFPTCLKTPQSDFCRLSYCHLNLVLTTRLTMKFWFCNLQIRPGSTVNWVDLSSWKL